MQENHSDCSRVAQHTLILGSSGLVEPDPSLPAQSAQPVNTTIKLDSLQESAKPNPSCVAPRASAIKEQASLIK